MVRGVKILSLSSSLVSWGWSSSLAWCLCPGNSRNSSSVASSNKTESCSGAPSFLFEVFILDVVSSKFEDFSFRKMLKFVRLSPEAAFLRGQLFWEVELIVEIVFNLW